MMLARPRLALAALFTIFGLLDTSYRYLDHVVRDNPVNFLVILIEQMSGHYGIGVILLPVVMALVRRGRLLWFPVGVLVASALHTSWNWVIRAALFPLCGLGAYDYGRMPIRYLMELPSDIIVSTVVSVVYWQFLAWRSREDLQKSLQAARTELLTRQLQPHFLFNALNTVSALMYEDVSRADRVLTRLGEFLRATIDLRDRPLIPLSEELALVDRYLAVMAARFEDRLQVEISVDSSTLTCQVPPLLLQPLIENAIEHGRNPASGQIRIRLAVTLAGSRLQFSLEDEGPGFASAASGFGFEAVHRRLEAAYSGDARLWLDRPELPGGRLRIEAPAC